MGVQFLSFEIEEIASLCEDVEFSENTNVVKEGQQNCFLHIVKSGSAAVEQTPKVKRERHKVAEDEKVISSSWLREMCCEKPHHEFAVIVSAVAVLPQTKMIKL